MARAADFRDRFHAGRRRTMVAMAAVARRRTSIMLLQKRHAMHAPGEFLRLIRRNPVPLHVRSIAVTCSARRGDIPGVHLRLYLTGRKNAVATVTAGAFGDHRITLCVQNAVNARTVFFALVDRERRIVHSDVGSIPMTLRARAYDIQRKHRRRTIGNVNDPMSVVAGCALNNALLATCGKLAVNAGLKKCKLVCRKF